MSKSFENPYLVLGTWYLGRINETSGTCGAAVPGLKSQAWDLKLETYDSERSEL